uniref:Uncharacterized protein n=1 Tax=Plagiogramma staurophorum TaxID=1003089 RepID=A0A2U9NMB0_9STRA|nr:hypothetical protein ycf90 [Plagiogramma staurophorum]AWT38228.1 hypothetical protein ycf90 [Plagiogramma staurophorum]
MLSMNYFSQLLFFEINLGAIFDWLKDELEDFLDPSLALVDDDLSILEDISNLVVKDFPDGDVRTFHIIVDAVWQRMIHGGLGLNDIENIILFLAFVRFIILVLRFNLKTGFLISCIGIIAAYLWYLHLSEILFGYINLLFKVPFMTSIALDLMDLRESKLDVRGENLSLRYPVRLIWRSLINSSQLDGHNIDPISMLFSQFPKEIKIYTDRLYYLVYRDIGPNILQLCRKVYYEIGPLLRYTFIVRVGKKYCPYLIRWHWTFLMLLQVTERFLIFLIYRISLYNERVLIPKYRAIDMALPANEFSNNNLINEISLLYYIAFTLIGCHIAFILYSLLQALWGQYFYIPFYTENVELHLGEVPNSPYVVGNMPWRYPKKIRHKYSDLIRSIPYNLRRFAKKSIKILFKMFKKIFRR